MYGVLYQAALYAVTFQCAIAMARYLPYSLPSDAGNTVGSATNSTMERMCKWGAREEDVNVGPVAHVLPYFILCPSTFTVVMCTIIFLAGIIKLQFLNWDDIWQADMMFMMAVTGTLIQIHWHRILMSIQVFLPINIWMASLLSAIIHPVWRKLFPGHYALCAEIQRKSSEEWARKAAERKRRREGVDLEDGRVENGNYLPEEAPRDDGINESTPLTGRGFLRMDDGAYVGLPDSTDVEF